MAPAWPRERVNSLMSTPAAPRPDTPPYGAAALRLLLVAAPYRFAKSMPQMPHWYTRRADWLTDSDFVAVVKFIRSAGETRHFKGRAYQYLDHEGFTYWTMGSPLPETVLINRAKLPAAP